MAKKRTPKTTQDRKQANFKELLNEALTMEGQLSDCYRLFWNYSFGNQLLAWAQLGTPEPINTFKGWESLGRKVKKGSKAIELIMPFTIKVDDPEKPDEKKAIQVFGFRRNWFGLSMTEGDKFTPPTAPGLSLERIREKLGITIIPFEHSNGNVQGYSTGLTYAINPLAKYPLKTSFHELAHIVLGHTGQSFDHTTARNIKEVEAEGVAYLLCHAFGYTKPAAESRGYIQNWLGTDEVPEQSCKNIFKAASEILKANREN